MAINSDSVVVAGTQSLTAADSSLEPIQQYTLRFENPKQQVIGFPAISDRAYPFAPFAVSPVGGSADVPVQVVSITPEVCTATGPNGTIVSILGAGFCTLRASQLGTFGWRAATPVERTFSTFTSQSISFAALPDKTFGDPPFIASATGGASGNPVNFSALTPTVCSATGTHGSTISLLTAGSCTIRASQAGGGNIAPAPNVDRTFAIAQIAQSISFQALSDRPFTSTPFAVPLAIQWCLTRSPHRFAAQLARMVRP
jgi:hypothetical protein